MKHIISFFIKGHPMPAGSKKYVGHSKAGKAIIVDMSGKKGVDWRKVCQLTAKEHYQGEPIDGPLIVNMSFFLLRPKRNYTSKGLLTKSAPKYHLTTPDKTKLCRATEDALTGILWRDDSLIFDGKISKGYVDYNFPDEGCWIEVYQPE
jgi:Holliday junction resolvase RusA-like endonuclease